MKTLLCSLACLCSWAGPASGAQVDRAALEALCAPYRGAGSAGMVIGVQVAGSEPFFEVCGMADIDAGEPLKPETPINTGSLSKQFVAAAIQQYVDAGELSVDDDITRFFPDAAWDGEIQVGHLLSHTSGLREHWAYWMLTRPADRTLDDVIRIICSQDELKSTPGTEFSYSNANYILLAGILEQLSGGPARDVLAVHVLQPAGMTDSDYFGAVGSIPPQVAKAYQQTADGFQLQTPPLSNVIGDGGLFASARDLLRWNARFFEDGQLPARTSLAGGALADYGPGLWISEHAGSLQVEHGGAAAGISAALGFIKSPDLEKADVSIVVLANTSAIDAAQVYEEVKAAVLGDEHRRPFPAYRESVSAAPGAALSPGRYAGFASGQATIFDIHMEEGTVVLSDLGGKASRYALTGDGHYRRSDQPLLSVVRSGPRGDAASMRLVYDTLALGYFTRMPAVPVDGIEGTYRNAEALELTLRIEATVGDPVLVVGGRRLSLQRLAEGIYQDRDGAYVIGFGKSGEDGVEAVLFHEGLGRERLLRDS